MYAVSSERASCLAARIRRVGALQDSIQRAESCWCSTLLWRTGGSSPGFVHARSLAQIKAMEAGKAGAKAVAPTPATHAILAQMKAGECARHSM